MIEFFDHSTLDRTRYEACLDKDSKSSIFARSYYLDAVAEQWGALVADDYAQVMPLPYRSKMGVSYLYQPVFSRELHISSNGRFGVEAFLKAIPDKFKYWDFAVNSSAGISLEDVELKTAVHQFVALNGETLSGFGSNCKRNIKKAKKADLFVEEASTLEAARQLVQLFQLTKGQAIKTLSETDYALLDKLMASLLQNKKGRVYQVKNAEGNVLGAGFFMFEKTTATYLKGAVTEEGKQFGAMHLLFAESIQTLMQEGFSILDFGGSKVESIARFYKNFGGEDRSYSQLTFNALPNWVKIAQKLRKK